MPIENSIQFGAAAAAVRPSVQSETQTTATPTAAAPVLGGPGVSVTVTGSQLDKLVAKVKGETEDARLDTAKRRIAIVLTALATANIRVSEDQKNALVQIELLQGQIDEFSNQLADKNGELAAVTARSAALEAQIEALENAVDNAIKEGEQHRKLVAELKKTRSEDDAELRAAEEALAKSDAAITAAQENLAKARTDLESAKTKSEGIQRDIATLKSQIASATDGIAECAAVLGDKTLQALATALRTTAADTDPILHQTDAEREKEEEKQIANDPLRAIREALDRMDDDVRKTIEDNRTTIV